MAAVEITNVIPSATHEQEDAWLYGDATKDPSQSTLDANAVEFVSKVQNGNADHSASDSDSDDDDDDDVQITIGEINKNAPATFGMASSFGPPQITPITQPKQVSVITAPPPTITHVSQPTTMTSKRTIDVNAVGNINGVPIYDYDIDTMCEEKPWRIPGADLTDYFNYGFNEESWKAYCDKQKGVRGIASEKNRELSVVQRPSVVSATPLPELPKLPGHHSGGTIGVLGAKSQAATTIVPQQTISCIPSIGSLVNAPRLMLPAGLGNVLFPPSLSQPAFLPMPQLQPPGLAPPPEMRPMIKQEDGSTPMQLPPSSGPLPPPTMFPPPGLPSMLPPPGANLSSMVPPMMLPPPAFSDESGASSDEESRRRRRSPRRSHSRERKRSRERRSRGDGHRERSTEHRSRSRRSPRKEKKSRKSARGDESRHRHRDEDRSKRSRRKKDSENGGEAGDNGVEAEQ